MTNALLPQITRERYPEIGELVARFIDVTATASANASTFYNTNDELKRAVDTMHAQILGLDRGLYAALLLLPGVRDYSRQLGILNLLQHNAPVRSMLTPEMEAWAINEMAKALPSQRRLKIYAGGDNGTSSLGKARINNSRTRKLILRTILADDSLEFLVVKYRTKVFLALRHAWGEKNTGVIRKILSKARSSWDSGEQTFIHKQVLKWAAGSNEDNVIQCVSFVLGNDGPFDLRKLLAYQGFKDDPAQARFLPPEVAEGLRAQYHPEMTAADILALSKAQMTQTQTVRSQRRARKANVQLEFDPMKSDAVTLYVLAYEEGMTPEIQAALAAKAEQAARQLPVSFESVGIVVDASGSMMGGKEQKNRPIAMALAARDMLEAASTERQVVYCGGEPEGDLVRPGGETSLAEGLLNVIEMETVFIISDGYENAPAGRVDEVIEALRSIGDDTPIFQFSPVLAAEAFGTRAVSEQILNMPLGQDVRTLGLGMIKNMLQLDFPQGIRHLVGLTVPQLVSGD